MKIEVFSDLICPWCYIGKRRLELALEQVQLSEPVEIVWRSFQLDPRTPVDSPMTLPEAQMSLFGMSQAQNDERLALITSLAEKVGLNYDLDHALVANTFDAHRLVHHASAQGKGTEVAEALMSAFTSEARWIGDPATLAQIASDAGLEPLPEGAYADDVRADRELAARYGITTVPTFVFNERQGLVAPELDQLVEALRIVSQQKSATA